VAFILLFVLFSAGLSTSTAQIHTMSTSLGYDILIRNLKAKPSVTLVRICAVVAVIVVGAVACILPKSIVAIATAIFFGIAAAVFLPSIIGAVFWKRCTRAAVLWSMSVGISAVLFSYLFMHERESAQLGLCNLLTGKPSLFTGSWLSMIDTSLIAVPLSFITLVLVTFLTRKTDEENI
jgi:SSS family solute:Na+ symporter